MEVFCFGVNGVEFPNEWAKYPDALNQMGAAGWDSYWRAMAKKVRTRDAGGNNCSLIRRGWQRKLPELPDNGGTVAGDWKNASGKILGVGQKLLLGEFQNGLTAEENS